DTIELSEAIQVALEAMGLTVFTASHGQDGIALYEREEPELIVLDLELPDMDGWNVLETIQERRRGREPIAVVTTVYGDVINRLMGRLQGVYCYLVKPFALDQIESVVIDALGLDPDRPVV
ncbi:MAG TPA: response regulator, partial [Aggregatilinea sp.]|uniref:response regulator n=1 Tax=Aggregatilinea sp. TaxID=2806333 RepID=UPI002B54E123